MVSCVLIPARFVLIKMTECIVSWNTAIVKIKVNMFHTCRILALVYKMSKEDYPRTLGWG